MTHPRRVLATILLAAAALTPAYARPSQNSGPAAPAPAATMTNKDVLDLVKAQLSPDIIVAKIQASSCSFDTSPSALKGLKSAGVPDAVILAMVKSSTGATGAPSKPVAGLVAHGRTLWIAKFTCPDEAASATAIVQTDDLTALKQSTLFDGVSSFSTDSEQPAGTWSLSAKVTSYAKGSASERVLLGLGTGRAHIVVAYELHDPTGAVVWSDSIKTEPSFWASGGGVGGIQDQHAATNEQSQKLLDALSKYFAKH